MHTRTNDECDEILHMKISEKQKKRLKRASKKVKISISELVRRAIDSKLELIDHAADTN